MNRFFCDQHWSTPFKHHSMLLREERIGWSPTTTKIGFVWDDGRIRNVTHLLCSHAASNETSCIEPSALISVRPTGLPFTSASTGTVRVDPMRARSTSQYGFCS